MRGIGSCFWFIADAVSVDLIRLLSQILFSGLQEDDCSARYAYGDQKSSKRRKVPRAKIQKEAVKRR
jgi:hypothetical protein